MWPATILAASSLVLFEAEVQVDEVYIRALGGNSEGAETLLN